MQFWSAPLQFEADGGIRPLERVPEWRLAVRIGATRAPAAVPYRWPKQKDDDPLKIHPCSSEPIPPEEWDTGEQP